MWHLSSSRPQLQSFDVEDSVAEQSLLSLKQRVVSSLVPSPYAHHDICKESESPSVHHETDSLFSRCGERGSAKCTKTSEYHEYTMRIRKKHDKFPSGWFWGAQLIKQPCNHVVPWNHSKQPTKFESFKPSYRQPCAFTS